ncbi:MAG: DUF6089 family protein [Flammeovirgaceae bacterium]
MKSSTFGFVLAVSLMILSFSVEAQRFTRSKRYWSIGGSINAMNYFGDITPSTSITSFEIAKTTPELSFFIQRRVLPNVTLRASLAYGGLQGDDYVSGDGDQFELANPDEVTEQNFRLFRNQHFRNRIAEVSGVAIFDFIQNRGRYFRRPEKPIPYAFVGIALGVQNAQVQVPNRGTIDLATNRVLNFDNAGEWVNLRDFPEIYEGGQAPSPFLISIPFGVGVRYKLSKKVDIAFEAGFRYTFTDLLDGVSGNYQQIDREVNGQPNLTYYISDRSSLDQAMDHRGNNVDRTHIVDGMRQVYGNNLESYSAPTELRGKGGFGNNDQYMVYGIHVSYILAYDVKCPKFR